MKKRIAETSTQFVGNGELTPCKDGKDSWIIKQMEKGKPIPGINVDKNDEQHWRFAAKSKRVASKLVSASEMFQIDKYFKQLSSTSSTNFRFKLNWSLKGEFDGASIRDLSLVKELLFTRVNNDFAEINKSFTTNLESLDEIMIDFASTSLICEAVISVEVNIVTDVKRIIEKLQALGFQGGELN